MSMSHLKFPLSVKSETSSYFSTAITLSGLKLIFTRLQTNKRVEDDSISWLRSIIRETVGKHIAGEILETVPLVKRRSIFSETPARPFNVVFYHRT